MVESSRNTNIMINIVDLVASEITFGPPKATFGVYKSVPMYHNRKPLLIGFGTEENQVVSFGVQADKPFGSTAQSDSIPPTGYTMAICLGSKDGLSNYQRVTMDKIDELSTHVINHISTLEPLIQKAVITSNFRPLYTGTREEPKYAYLKLGKGPNSSISTKFYSMTDGSDLNPLSEEHVFGKKGSGIFAIWVSIILGKKGAASLRLSLAECVYDSHNKRGRLIPMIISRPVAETAVVNNIVNNDNNDNSDISSSGEEDDNFTPSSTRTPAVSQEQTIVAPTIAAAAAPRVVKKVVRK